jgi:hypothetical protein
MVEQAELERVLAGAGASQGLRRIGGGSETDVYTNGDGQNVYKVKQLAATTAAAAHAEVVAMRVAAQRFVLYLGAEHSIPTDFLLSEDGTGRWYAVAIQPYLHTAQPLAAIDIQSLSREQRLQVEWQLASLLHQALRCYQETGHMPDLYGTFSHNIAERRRMNAPLLWPWRLWLFFTQRLWSAHNLLLTDEPLPRVVLVDYDQVRWRGLWGRLYSAICWLFFCRDLIWLAGREANTQLAKHIPHVGSTCGDGHSSTPPHNSASRPLLARWFQGSAQRPQVEPHKEMDSLPGRERFPTPAGESSSTVNDGAALS